jgi:Tol biopolymer transport system component
LLNHPNIGAIYGFEEAGDVEALVLELVEGPTLADRLARGRISVEEALPIARQIAEALEAAHERGVVHRDLKPANIKVRTDGVVKVLDFGLAKALEVESSGPASESPTVPSPVFTADGIIVGTPAYMAPEQVRGAAADRRADLWAFGCVLYEMLAGRRAFAGEDIPETLAAVLKDDPDWRALPDKTPSPIRRLLQRCLAKDPKARVADASMARIEIDDAVHESSIDLPAGRTSAQRRERVLWASALAIALILAVAALVRAFRPPLPSGEAHFEITTPPTSDPASLAISPDGQQIVFVAASQGRNMLWLYRLDSGTAAPLAGTDGATAPFWSRDSRSVAFFSMIDNGLKRIDVDGRSLQVLGIVPLGTAGTWNQDGTILYAGLGGPGPIFRISSTGGDATPATRLAPTEQIHQFPHFLPDGRHFVYHAPNAAPPAVYLGRLDGSEARRLVEADSGAVYLSGHLLFLRQRTLFAQAFDPLGLAVDGSPFRVADDVASVDLTPAVSASTSGTLVYRGGSAVSIQLSRPLIWFDRSGARIGTVGGSDVGIRPSLSHDGRHIALHRSVGTSPPEIWRVTLDGGRAMKLTSNGFINLDPVWSPNDSRIVYASNPEGQFDLYVTSADGAAAEELLLGPPGNKVPSDWSPDRRFVLFETITIPKFAFDIWSIAVDGDRKPFPVVATTANERQGQFSPDGQWLAYQSDETGRFEIYVQRFPGPGGKRPISTNGGAQVRWRRDGRELFYIAMDGRLMAVPIRFAADGQAVDVGTPAPLFATQVGGTVRGLDRQQYVVSPDGQRFLMSVIAEDPNPPPLEVILNWQPRPRG